MLPSRSGHFNPRVLSELVLMMMVRIPNAQAASTHITMITITISDFVITEFSAHIKPLKGAQFLSEYSTHASVVRVPQSKVFK
jgi:hypothetical protein